ncbi:MAG: DUF4231 domain-containing protein [Solirubrobacteraceae bacterium]|nr:DUF4231 domain-containing protein [Solirubrobacteraceae bacterium]
MNLDETDLPALFRAADGAAASAQRRYLRLFKFQNFGLVVAAVAGAASWKVGSVEVAGLAAVIAFLGAAAAAISLGRWDVESRWYEARALAESAKTLAWNYAVCGASFPSSMTAERAPTEFAGRLHDLLSDFEHLDDIQQDGGPSVTPAMDALRSSPSSERRLAYLEGRIEDQRGWYAQKSQWNATWGRRWFAVVLGLDAIGVLLGAARAFDVVDIDGLGVLAALAAVVGAWTKAKQHETLATAYSLAANELVRVRDTAPLDDSDQRWGEYVQDAEEAISREHTMWKATRGTR